MLLSTYRTYLNIPRSTFKSKPYESFNPNWITEEIPLKMKKFKPDIKKRTHLTKI